MAVDDPCDSPMLSLTIIGAGRVGRTLGRLWHQGQHLSVRDILNSSRDSAEAASAFIGAGRACASYAELRPADIILISVPDDQISQCCEELVTSGAVAAETIVFHVSGARPSSLLNAVHGADAFVASVHPMASFADPALSVSSFSGTWCVAEGDADALDVLSEVFRAAGASVLTIHPAHKPVYHAAGVMVSNYVVALLETGMRSFAHAGIARDSAMLLCEPMVRGVVENVFRLGTHEALTGPVMRGDVDTVRAHLQALDAWDDDVAGLYRVLGQAALRLACEQKTLSAAVAARLRGLLAVTPTGEDPRITD